MKTPHARRAVAGIVFVPPAGVVFAGPSSAPPSEAEARAIVRAIAPRFAEFAGQFQAIEG
jgi:hypothetical protein